MAFDDFESDLYPLVTAPKKKFSRTKTGDLGYGGCAPWTPAKSRLATGFSAGWDLRDPEKVHFGKIEQNSGKKTHHAMRHNLLARIGGAFGGGPPPQKKVWMKKFQNKPLGQKTPKSPHPTWICESPWESDVFAQFLKNRPDGENFVIRDDICQIHGGCGGPRGLFRNSFILKSMRVLEIFDFT